MIASVSPEADRELTEGALYYVCRRFPVRKFPYSVVYYIRGNEVRVVALAHHRRRRDYWASRR